MARFEKIEKIDGCEVTLVASYNNIRVYQDTGDKGIVWNVIDDIVVFSYIVEFQEITVTEEYNKL